MQAIDKINKAKEVLSWCQENADEEWMVKHLALVRLDIDATIALLKKQPDLEAENTRLRECIKEIEDVSCGEKQVAEDDSEGMGWIYKRILALNTGGGQTIEHGARSEKSEPTPQGGMSPPNLNTLRATKTALDMRFIGEDDRHDKEINKIATALFKVNQQIRELEGKEPL